jgi:hypothetical protein
LRIVTVALQRITRVHRCRFGYHRPRGRDHGIARGPRDPHRLRPAPAELIDIITALENSKRAHAALQTKATAAYATQVRDAEDNRDKTSAAISREVALARKCSPHTGGTWLGVADALTTEMPHTVQALRDGRICELTARDIVAQTTHISAEHRAIVDAALTREFQRAGATRHAIRGSARALADQLDPAAAVERRRRAKATAASPSAPAKTP